VLFALYIAGIGRHGGRPTCSGASGRAYGCIRCCWSFGLSLAETSEISALVRGSASNFPEPRRDHHACSLMVILWALSS